MALGSKWTALVIIVLAFVNATDCCFSRACPGAKSSDEKTPVSFKCISTYKRGLFERQKWTENEILILGVQLTRVAEIAKEMKCNHAFFVLSYLYRVDPLEYSRYPEDLDDLHKKMKGELGWSEKMLVIAFRVTQSDTEMVVPWLMFLYVKWIEERMPNDFNSKFLKTMVTTNNRMIYALANMMDKECIMYSEMTDSHLKFSKYSMGMRPKDPSDTSVNSTAVLNLLNLDVKPKLVSNYHNGCSYDNISDTGPVRGFEPLCDDHLTVKFLYLNDMFDNSVGPLDDLPRSGKVLLVDFGLLDKGNNLLSYLTSEIAIIKGSKSFKQYVISMAKVHRLVWQAINTMMLRIIITFLEKLRQVKLRCNRKKHVKQFLRPYKDWCIFFHVSKADYLYKIFSTGKKDNDKSFSSKTIIEIKGKVVGKLKELDHFSNDGRDNQSVDVMKRIEFDATWLQSMASKYDFMLNTKFDESNWNHTGKTILCAEVLTGFLKKMFSGLNFKAVKSLATIENSEILEHF